MQAAAVWQTDRENIKLGELSAYVFVSNNTIVYTDPITSENRSLIMKFTNNRIDVVENGQFGLNKKIYEGRYNRTTNVVPNWGIFDLLYVR